MTEPLRSRRSFGVQTLALLFLFAVDVGASLVWDQKEVKLKVHPTQVSSTAVFRFVNSGNEPVTLQRVEAGCGCLSSKLKKKVVAPGEQGELEITIDLKNRVGKQRKMTTVTTSDGQRTKLVVDTTIPPSYALRSKLVLWNKDCEDEQKIVRLLNNNDVPIKLLSIKSTHRHIRAELKTIREGYEYEVVVIRSTPKRNIRTFILIETEPPPGQTKSKTLRLYAHVQ